MFRIVSYRMVTTLRIDRFRVSALTLLNSRMRGAQMTGITDVMRQYEKNTEQILKNRPKHSKEYGIKLPEMRNIMIVLAALVLVLVAASQMM